MSRRGYFRENNGHKKKDNSHNKKHSKTVTKNKNLSFENVTLIKAPVTSLITLFKIIIDLIVAIPKYIVKHYIVFGLLPI